MDLNGDDLLTRDEYLRYIRLKDINDAQKEARREPARKPFSLLNSFDRTNVQH